MKRERTVDLCVGKWRSILTSLGVPEDRLSGKHGPCVLCGGKDRFRFDDKDGRGTWFCTHCGAGDGLGLVQKFKGMDFKTAAREVDALIGAALIEAPRAIRSEADKAEALRKAYRESRAVTEGDPVSLYLFRRCGISDIPSDIRYHPSLRYDRERSFPAMLAVVTMPDGKPSTMHRTWLTLDGQKAPVEQAKKVMSGVIKTGAIRLAPTAESMGIAEGIETALSALVRFGFPTWAAISAGGMRDWEPPEGLRHLVVFGDNDENYTGQSAAFALAHRLSMGGIKTEVRIPAKVGTDWADE